MKGCLDVGSFTVQNLLLGMNPGTLLESVLGIILPGVNVLLAAINSFYFIYFVYLHVRQ